MADVPQAAIDAAATVLREAALVKPGSPGSDMRSLATAVLLAAEHAWPHEPPKRDPASTTAAVTAIATPPAASARRREFKPAFGFTTSPEEA